jgi:ABC-2 type transport system ATP-binding protein
MIEIQSLSKRFGAFTAVDQISLKVETGEVLGFLGPNGAGKSTTIRMTTGFLRPSSGTARIGGADVFDNALEARRRFGYLPEGAPAWPDMTPLEFLRFCGRARALGSGTEAAIQRVVGQVHLEGVLHQPIETLSKGYKRRVGLAQAILHDPAALIMDEPTDGLDPNQKHDVRELIRGMAKQKAILLSTHILEEVEALCTRVVVISAGKVVADGTPEQLMARSPRHQAVRLVFQGQAPAGASEALARLAEVARVEGADGSGELLALAKAGQRPTAAVGELARSKGWALRELISEKGRLDEVFRLLTKNDGERAVARGGAA